MRQAFLQVATPEQAQAQAPWAAVIEKVEGGFHVFESVQDAETWRNQQ